METIDTRQEDVKTTLLEMEDLYNKSDKINLDLEISSLSKEIIQKAIYDGLKYGYNLKDTEHRYFFVDKFFDTDFKKITPRAPMGSRIFDLSQILSVDTLPNEKTIAELLKNHNWS